MILCGDTTDVGGVGVRVGGGCPSRKDIGWRRERVGRVKNKYVTISDGANILEGSLSMVRTVPPHNLDTPHGLVASNTHTHNLL